MEARTPGQLKLSKRLGVLCFGLLWFALAETMPAADTGKATNQLAGTIASQPLAAVLAPAKWKQVENMVDLALAYLASRQAADGSFPTMSSGQPAVTSLCTMAFL